MPVPVPSAPNLVLARWAKRALTYGASAIALLSGGLYFLFHTANKAALSPFGLDPSGFSGSASEMIGGGLASLFVLSVVMFLLYWPIGWPVGKISKWIAGLYIGLFGKPAFLVRLETWIRSDPAKRSQRAFLTGASVIVPLVAFLLFWSGSTIGGWRVSQAHWLVSANNCANKCFAYKVEGRPESIIGHPIASNSTRMAVVVGQGKVEAIEVSKIIAVTQHKGKAVILPDNAPWKLRWGWRFLDLVNANW